MNVLIAEILKPPDLRFSYSSPSVRHTNPRQGLKLYGPYDYTILGKSIVRVAIVFPSALTKLKDTFIKGLTDGYGSFLVSKRCLESH